MRWKSRKSVKAPARPPRPVPDVTRKSGYAPFATDLNTPLLRLSPHDVYTCDEACKGIHVFGQTGAGKTTAARVLAGAFLRAGFGGIVTAVKSEEISLWKRYAAEHGRSKSLFLFDETEGFNFLHYLLARYGVEGIGTITETVMKIVEAARSASGTASKHGGEPIWEDSLRVLLRHALPLLYAAHGTLSVGDILRFISTAATTMKQADDKEWQDGSFMWETLKKASHAPAVRMEPADLQNAVDYWYRQYTAIPDKMRGSIVGTAIAALDRFQHGRLRKAFCTKTTWVPELSFQGLVTVFCMPTLAWGIDGVIGQQLLKYLWQLAALNRNALAEKHRERFLFLWSDESQETANSYDGEFLSTCRGAAKCCVIFLTQSLPNYYVKMNGDNPRDAAHMLIGKFNTHLFFANACPETNEWASRVIGKVVKRRANYSAGHSHNYSSGMSQGQSDNNGTSHNHGSSYSHGSGGVTTGTSSGGGSNSGMGSTWGMNVGSSFGSSTSRGYTESLEYAIEPGEFARAFKTGGRANNYEVTGIWFQSARTFAESGCNFLWETFTQ